MAGACSCLFAGFPAAVLWILMLPAPLAASEDSPQAGAAGAEKGFRWISNLEQGLSESADRKAPILAFFWDYN